jgi:hypothetical protein
MKPSVWTSPHHDVAEASDSERVANAPHADAVLAEIATILVVHLALALAVIGAFKCWTSS